jgi:hypothetical protein
MPGYESVQAWALPSCLALEIDSPEAKRADVRTTVLSSQLGIERMTNLAKLADDCIYCSGVYTIPLWM